MKQFIAHVTLMVREYDEAIDFYVRKLGFDLVEDTPLSELKRWVLVAPPGSTECRLLLAKASDYEQAASIGRQTGGRVFLFLYTDDLDRDYKKYIHNGVRFIEPPRHESYGSVAVFEDMYGNRWDLLEKRASDAFFA